MAKKSAIEAPQNEAPEANTQVELPVAPDRLITVQEFAAMLQVSTTTIFNWGNPKKSERPQGFPVSVALGEKRTRWKLKEVQAFIASLQPSRERPHHLRQQQAA